MPNQLLYPIDRVYITQHFGERPNVYSAFGMKGHNGTDFRTRFIDSPLGHRYITACYEGYVLETRSDSGYGVFVRLKHDDGSQTVYAHLKKSYVSVNERVSSGQRIGLSNNTGFSSGPHLHLGYRPPNWDYNNGFKGYIDPFPLLRKELIEDNPGYDPAFAASFNGFVLVDADDHGRKWFIFEGKRYEIDKAPNFEQLIRNGAPFAKWISHNDLLKIEIGQ